jgi:hypothetical protein
VVAQPEGPVVVPLHRYKADDDKAGCAYRVGQGFCGQGESSSLHAVVRLSEPVNMSGHAWRNLNPPGYAPDQCTFSEGDEVCGRIKSSKIHAGYAPQLTDDDEPDDEELTHPDVAVGEFLRAGSSEAIVDEFMRRVLVKVRAKDAYYGEAWRRRGWNGNLTRILTKADRLEHMLMNDHPMTTDNIDESVLDTVEDLAALCAFFAVNFSDRNRFGGRQ